MRLPWVTMAVPHAIAWQWKWMRCTVSKNDQPMPERTQIDEFVSPAS